MSGVYRIKIIKGNHEAYPWDVMVYAPDNTHDPVTAGYDSPNFTSFAATRDEAEQKGREWIERDKASKPEPEWIEVPA